MLKKLQPHARSMFVPSICKLVYAVLEIVVTNQDIVVYNAEICESQNNNAYFEIPRKTSFPAMLGHFYYALVVSHDAGTTLDNGEEIGTGVANITEKIGEERLRWLGHVKRKTERDVVCRNENMEVGGHRMIARPKPRWSDVIRIDMKEKGVKIEDAKMWGKKI